MLLQSCAEEGLCPEDMLRVKDFTSQGAPDLKRYFGMCPNGYGFIYIDNKDECAYQEAVNFTKFEDLQLMKPYKGNTYDVTV